MTLKETLENKAKQFIAGAAAIAALATGACNDKEPPEPQKKEDTQKDENDDKFSPVFPEYKKPTDEHFYKKISKKNNDLIDKGWDKFGAPLTAELETFVKPSKGKPSFNTNENRCTIGHGNTYTFAGPDKDGFYYLYACTENSVMNQEVMFHYKWNDRLWFMNQLKLHLKTSTLPRLRAALSEYHKTPEELSDNELWALLFIGVQLEDNYAGLVQRLFKNDINTEKKINAFLYHAGTENTKEGSLDRHYWLGLLYANKITIEQISNFPLDKFSMLNPSDILEPVDNQKPSNAEKSFMTKDENGVYKKFKTSDASIKDNIKKVQNSGNQTVKDYLEKVNNDKNDMRTKEQIANYLNEATENLKNQKYDEAITIYNNIVKVDKNKDQSYNDLITAITHIKSNKYDKAIETIKFYTAPTHIDLYAEAHFLYIAGIVRDKQAKNELDTTKKTNLYKKAFANFVAAYDKVQNESYKNAKDNSETTLEEAYNTAINAAKQNLTKNYIKNPKHQAELYYNIGQLRENLSQLYKYQQKFDAAKKQLERAIKNYEEAIKIDKDRKLYKDAKSGAEKKLKNLQEYKQTSFNNAKHSKNGIFMAKLQHSQKAAQILKRFNHINN